MGASSTPTMQKTEAPPTSSGGEWEVVHPKGVALRSSVDYNSRISSVEGPLTHSKIVATGPPQQAIGSGVQMIQISHINGQMYPPNPNAPKYWIPLSTSEGQ